MRNVLRHILRILAWLILSLTLLVLVAATTLILWARSRAGRQLLKSTIISTLHERLDGRVTISALEGDLTRTCVLRDVRVYDRERRLAVAFPQIRLEYALAALLSRTIRIRSVEAEGSVHARTSKDGQLNLATLLRPNRPSGADQQRRSWNLEVAAAHVGMAFLADGASGHAALRGQLAIDGAGEARHGGYDVEVTRFDAAIDTPTHATIEASGATRWANGLPFFRDVQLRFRTSAEPLLIRPGFEIRAPFEAIVRGDGRALTAVATTTQGDLRGDARAEIGGDGRVRWTANARTTNLDPAAVLARAPHGHLELAARASGEGRAASLVVDAMRLDVAGAQASANGRVDLGPLRMDVRGDVRSPDLARIAGAFGIDMRGALAAHFHLRRTVAGNAIDATVHAHHLGLGRARVAALAAHLRMKNLVGGARIAIRDASLAARAAPHVVARMRSIDIRLDGDGRRLAVAVDGEASDASRLRMRAEAMPLPGATPYAAAIAIRELTAGGHQPWRLTRPAELLIGRKAIAAQMSLAAGAQSFVLDGAIAGAPARIDLRARAQHLDVAALARALGARDVPSTDLELEAEAHGELRAPRAKLQLRAQTSSGEQLRAHADWLGQPDGVGHVDGELAVSGLQLSHLRPLLPPSLRSLSGHGWLTARIGGTTSAPTLTAHAALEPWRLDENDEYRTAVDVAYQSGRLDLKLDARSLRAERRHVWMHAQLPLTLTPTERGLRPTLAATTPLAVTVRGQDFALSRLPLRALGLGTPLRDGVADLSIDVTGTVAAPTAAVHVDVRDLSVADVDGLALRVDAAIREQHANAILRATRHGAPLLDARAESPLDARQLFDANTRAAMPMALRANLSAHDLSALAGMAGTVDARAEMTGTFARPRFSAELHGRNLRMSTMTFQELDAEAAWDGGLLAAALRANDPSNGAVELTARVPRNPREPIDARVQLRGLKIALDHVGKLRRLEATADADLRLTGPRSAPIASGLVKVTHGAFAVGATSRLYHDLTLDLALGPGSVELRQLAVAADDGKLVAHGRLTLDGLRPRSAELVAEADHFPFQPANAEAWIDARLEMHGHGTGDRFDGTITLSDGHAQVPSLDRGPKLQPTGPLEDVVFVDEPSRQRSRSLQHRVLEEARALDVSVLARIPGPFRIESQDLRADLQGELELRAHGGTVGIYGEAETTSGRVELLDRPYEIERARVSFNGSFNPLVDVRLTREVTGAKVVIAVHGTAEHPDLELTSDPPIYNKSQIIGLVIAGDPETRQIDAHSSNEQIAGALSGILVGHVIERIAPGLPIDVIRLETGGGPSQLASFQNARLETGKYIRQDIYVSYVHRFGATEAVHRNNRHEANVEYRFRRRFVVGMRYGDAGIGALDLSWSLSF